MSNQLIKELIEINYQRNGVGGEGFFQLLVKDQDNQDLLITFVYDDSINTESCRVVNINDFSLRYRGDEFARDLNKLLFSKKDFKDYFESRDQHFNFLTKKIIKDY